MDVTARIELVITGTDDELAKRAPQAVAQRADVRWRTGDDGSPELRVSFPRGPVLQALTQTARVLPSNMVPDLWQ